MSRIFSVVPSGRAAARPALILAVLVAASTTAPVAAAQDTTAAAKPAPASVTSTVTTSTIVAPAPRTDSASRAALPPASTPKTPSPAATSVAQPASVKPLTSPTVVPAGAPAAAEAPADDLANAYVQRAVSLYELGKDEAALAEYRRGIAADPLDSDTWYGLADLLHELGRDKQAIETYTLALSTIEHAPELRLPFAELLMANQRKADAIKVLQRGIEIDPNASADLKDMLGKVLYGVLGDSTNVAATPAAVAPVADTLKKTPATKAKSKTARKKRKPLCNLFCPGTLDAVAPKP